MFKTLKTLGVIFAAFVANTASVDAQIFTAPTAPEFIYNSANVYRSINTHNYSLANLYTGFGYVDLYISAWGTPNANSEFIWQFTTPGNPTSVIAQGTFLYSGVADLSVGLVHNSITGNMNLLAVYDEIGVGHKMDIYDVTMSTFTPVVYNSTMVLSSSASYGRIRIDSHKLYGVAVAWYYPGIGIQTLVGNNGTWSGVTTLTGTVNEMDPDVAFSHSSGPLNVHYAYNNPGTGQITESVIDWNILLTTPGTYSPTIEDINFIGFIKDLKLVIDCPDHYDVENWAYTYTTNNQDVFVRYIDYHSTAIPTTVSVNSGALGNAPTIGNYKVYSPTLYYGMDAIGGSTDQIHVGWYMTDGGGFNGYVGLHMKENGLGLISAPDYMALPNAFTPSIYSTIPGISYSKISDPGLAPGFMYATYYDLSNNYDLHHAFHSWSSPVFKGSGAPTVYHPECGNGITTENTVSSESIITQKTDKVNLYPNPFNDAIHTTVTLSKDGIVQLELLDLTGRPVWQYKAFVTKGIHEISSNNLNSIAPGNYFMTTSLDGEKVSVKSVVKQ